MKHNLSHTSQKDAVFVSAVEDLGSLVCLVNKERAAQALWYQIRQCRDPSVTYLTDVVTQQRLSSTPPKWHIRVHASIKMVLNVAAFSDHVEQEYRVYWKHKCKIIYRKGTRASRHVKCSKAFAEVSP